MHGLLAKPLEYSVKPVAWCVPKTFIYCSQTASRSITDKQRLYRYCYHRTHVLTNIVRIKLEDNNNNIIIIGNKVCMYNISIIVTTTVCLLC